MISSMLVQVNKYFKEALDCDPLVMASLLNPHFRIGLFNHAFGDASPQVQYATDLIRKHFEQRKGSVVPLSNQENDSASSIAGAAPKRGIFSLYKSATAIIPKDEIAAYFAGQDPMSSEDNPHDPNTALLWWKVSFFFFSLIPICSTLTDCIIHRNMLRLIQSLRLLHGTF